MALQIKTAVFDGTQDSIDLAWDVEYEHFRLLVGRRDPIAMPTITFENVTPAGVRVVVAARGSFSIDVHNTEVNAAILSIAITPASATMGVGDSSSFTVTATYDDGTTADITADVDWSVDNEAIASITPTGIVTAVALGVTTVAATYGSLRDETTVTVGTGEDIMLAARYTVTAGDVAAGGDDFTIPLDLAQVDNQYGAFAFVAEGDSTVECQTPISGRTTTQVNVLSTAPLDEGDIIEVFIAR